MKRLNLSKSQTESIWTTKAHRDSPKLASPIEDSPLFEFVGPSKFDVPARFCFISNGFIASRTVRVKFEVSVIECNYNRNQREDNPNAHLLLVRTNHTSRGRSCQIPVP
jgi:hypothetical protein